MGTSGGDRAYVMIQTDLADYREIRSARSGTINDVVLTVLSGALRAWLLSRGSSVGRDAYLRALVPMSMRDGGIASYLVNLPVGEPDPVVRLHQIGYRMSPHNLSQARMGAESLVLLSGFAPPTLHALGARVAGGLSRRSYNLVITNAPGPQEPRFAGDARLVDSYPVPPIPPGQALSIGVTSYLGHVGFGIIADRKAMPDLDVLAQCVVEALEELRETHR